MKSTGRRDFLKFLGVSGLVGILPDSYSYAKTLTPATTKLKAPHSSIQKKTLNITPNGVKLAIHGWVPKSPEAILFYIHGIQSHAGWLYETGPFLAERNIAVYVLDRRGSGTSEGERGDSENYQLWIDDYLAALEHITKLNPKIPVTLLGQSMGGTVLAGLLASGKAKYDSIVWCAPSLDQFSRFKPERIETLKNNQIAFKTNPEKGLIYGPIPLKDEWYTEQPEYLEFMKNDKLMTRQTTARFNVERYKLEQYYLDSKVVLTNKPTLFARPRTDKIIDLDVTFKYLSKLTNGELITTIFPVDDHYLEFSKARIHYLNLLSHFILSLGFNS